MPLIDPLIQEFQHEAIATRKVLDICPDAEFGWKPHPKSMSLGHLATHIAEIPGWITMMLTTTELDFAKGDYKPAKCDTHKDLTAHHDKNVAAALKQMKGTTDEDLAVNWTMRHGEQIFFTLPRKIVMRTWCYSHLFHHRGQLTVYLRLKDIPLPNVYGPTADAPGM